MADEPQRLPQQVLQYVACFYDDILRHIQLRFEKRRHRYAVGSADTVHSMVSQRILDVALHKRRTDRRDDFDTHLLISR